MVWYYRDHAFGSCRNLRCGGPIVGWCVLWATTLSIVVICLQMYACLLPSLGYAPVVFFFCFCCLFVFCFFFSVVFLFLCLLFFGVFSLFVWFLIFVFRINGSLIKEVEENLALTINQTGSFKDNKKVDFWLHTTE
jgi:hypothetical protein